MSSHVTAPSPAARRTPRRNAGRTRRHRSLAVAIAYVAVWATGLAVWPDNLSPGATVRQVGATYGAAEAQAITQYVLVEGVAGILLAAIMVSLWRVAATRRSGLVGLVAAAVSVLQSVLGVVLTLGATVDAGRSHTLFQAVNQLDGVKMWLLAASAIGLALGAARRSRHRGFAALSAATGLALVASGAAYLTLSGGLAWTAYISGPLLLAWALATGARLDRAPTAAVGDAA